MSPRAVQSYVARLRRSLRLRGLLEAGTMVEIEDHLREAVRAGLEDGLALEEAERRALARFGTVSAVTRAFARERRLEMQYLLLALGTAAGLAVTYVDSRPTWDDTGVTAGLLFLSAGLLTLLGFRRPWLMGLAVGIWLPGYYLFRSHDPLMLIVLLIPLAGAYIGWGIRLGLRKAFNWA
jgi:hypothetical protein